MATETWDRVRLSRASDEIVSQLSDALFAEETHNRVHVPTLTSSQEALRTHRPSAPPEPKRIVAIHSAMLDAFRQRDAQRAGELMLEDVQRQRDWSDRRSSG